MLSVLSIILVALLYIICGNKGAISVIATLFNLGLLFGGIFLIYLGVNELVVILLMALLITIVILFYQKENDAKTKLAFLAVLLVIVILLPFLYYVTEGANVNGFTFEQFEIRESNGYSKNIDINMLYLQIGLMIIALLGTVIDTAIGIITAVFAIKEENKDIKASKLYLSAIKVSKAILNTSIHTIFYIYLAEYLALFIQFMDGYSPLVLMNNKAFVQSFLTISLSGIGCCLVVPIATLLSGWYLKKSK